MVVNSQLMEFGNELAMVIPTAYSLYKEGRLKKTISGRGSRWFYYFSPNHEEVDEPRHWANSYVHVKDYVKGQCPPYKEVYKNDEMVFSRPICVIANKYNKEWNGPPVNYYPVDVLLRMIDELDDYQVIYNRKVPNRYRDDQEVLSLGDHEAIRSEFPDVLFLEDLGDDYNLTQLKVYANCDKFYSVQGGNSILASCFGGENTIYAVRGQELNTGVYWRLGGLSGCRIKHSCTFSV